MSTHPLPGRACLHAREENLIWPINHQVSQQIRVDLVLRMLLARVGRLVDRNQPHQPHQTAHPVAATFMALSLHVAGHLPRSIPRRLQELLVDDAHQPQIFGAFALRLVIQVRARQRKQPALSPHTQFMISAHHFLPRFPSN